jgi:hypothetical protein
LVEWIDYGQQSIELYSYFRKSPVFCHEELIISTLEKDQSAHSAK